MNNQLLKFYQNQKKSFEKAEQQLVKNVRWIVFFRFLSFVSIPFSLIYLTRFGTWVGVAPSIVFLIVFFLLVKKHLFAEKQRKRFSILISLVKDEIEALAHKFSQFDNGGEFLSPDHIFSYDLDMFGDVSVFQFINRTSTISGRKTLAGWLLEPPLLKDVILERQSAVKELAKKREWRMSFLSSGHMFDESAAEHREVESWQETDLPFKNFNLIGVLKLIFPVITLLMLFPGIIFGEWAPMVICVLIQWLFVIFYGKRIKEYYRFFGRKSKLIEKYVSLLNEIENEQFDSSWLKNQHSKISSPELASQIIGKLGRLIHEFEFRQNILVGFVLNSIFLWDIRCIYQLRKWHIQNRVHLGEWLEVIENVDALISLANLADNHPEYTYPIVKAGSFVFDAKSLGHPILNPEKRVCSDFNISDWSQVIIVTGANMAGKSTFLRAVGVNLILARTGAPVCASEFIYTPIELFTNMRTTDSLFNDESYFFAELKRLSNVLQRLQKGQELFVILDEMLKGTNSVDKLNGSKELIKKLVQFKSVSLIATHDLKLSEMEKEFPNNVYNKCFEINIIDNELVFDYKLSGGVTKMMNATFLMKKMGII